MVYSDTTNRENGLIQHAEFLTGQGVAGISGTTAVLADFTRLFNVYYAKIVIKILHSMDDFDWDDPNQSDFPIVTTPLSSSDRHYTIPLSEKVLKIKRIDITYDNSKYYRATPLDVNELAFGVGNDTDVDSNFDKTAPRYDLKYNAWWLYPMASAAEVAAGAKARIHWSREADSFVVGDTTQEPGIEEAFHHLIAVGAALEWISVKKPKDTVTIQMLQNMWNEGIRDLEDHYSTKNEDVAESFGADLPNYN